MIACIIYYNYCRDQILLMSACIHTNAVECLIVICWRDNAYFMLRCLNELAVSVMSLVCVLFHRSLYLPFFRFTKCIYNWMSLHILAEFKVSIYK